MPAPSHEFGPHAANPASIAARESTWRARSGARTAQAPSASDSPPELRTLRALAHLAPVRACGTHVKLTVIATMMGDMAVEGLGLCPASGTPELD